MTEEDGTSTSGPDTAKTMIVFCGVAFVIFGCIYLVIWNRSKENERDGQQARSRSANASNHTDRSEETPDSAQPTNKFTQAWQPKEPEPGDPIYDKFIVGGTASNGILMFIGATIVLSVSLRKQSEFDGASVDDFVSLGPTGCRIINSSNYRFYDERVNARNSLCIEEWEYSVQVEDTTFVSAAMTSAECRASCDICENRLYGPNYYVGLDKRRRGKYISDTTFVECFAPTVSVEELSDFYDCGRQRTSSNTCYVLQDETRLLEKATGSVDIALKVTYTSYATGFVLMLVVAFFMFRNKQVRVAALEAQEVCGSESNVRPVGEDNGLVDNEGIPEDVNCDGLETDQKTPAE